MPTIKIENTTDAAITLPRTAEEAYLFPRAVTKQVRDEKTGDTKKETTCTQVECDEETITKLRENNKVVAAYFTKKMLRVVGSGPPPGTTTVAGGKAK